MGGECEPREILEKLDRSLRSREVSRWINDTMKAFGAALAGIAERRLSDVIAALFLSQVGASVYAALRVLGMSEERAFEGATETLCKIYRAAVEVLRESFREGTLEKQYREALETLSRG